MSNAYRKLSRVHHPDRGGDLTSWEITRQCHRLLRDEERLMAYVMGRNHSEFVESEREDLTMKQRVERMAAARVAELEDRQKVKPSRVGRGRAEEASASLFKYEKGEGAGTDAKRRARKTERLVLEDLDAKFGRMPKPSVKVEGLGLMVRGGISSACSPRSSPLTPLLSAPQPTLSPPL